MSPESYIGAIGEFAGNYSPKQWADCSGQLLKIQQYTALFSILGTAYGGDGVNTFALPDLRPFDNTSQKDTGRKRVDWSQMGMPRKCICIVGLYPSRD